eukprot:COSAG01_NODE_46595_length_398_cov_22.180602_1_plen_53_part_10
MGTARARTQGNPAFVQSSEHPWVARLQGWSGLAPEVVTYGTNATGYDAECVKA